VGLRKTEKKSRKGKCKAWRKPILKPKRKGEHKQMSVGKEIGTREFLGPAMMTLFFVGGELG